MHAVVWITETTWEACVADARELLPRDAAITLLHVAPGDVEEVAAGGRLALLGRHPAPPAEPLLQVVSEQEAQELLADARAALERPARLLTRRGRPEREVLAACAGADLLVLARDGDAAVGPKSLGPRTRFVVDHAPCRVLLVWGSAPRVAEAAPHPRP